jgi:hypothetical protein
MRTVMNFPAMRRPITFVAICGGIVLALLLLIWASSGFGDLGMSGHGLVAMILGVLFTTVLGAGLMWLIFHSHGVPKDEELHDPGAAQRK